MRGLDVGSDFFALGGDSILGAEAVARVRDLVGDPDLPLISIVRAPTPAAMASEVVSYVGLGSSGAVPLQREGTRTPLFLVHPGDGELLTYPALATTARAGPAELRPARARASTTTARRCRRRCRRSPPTTSPRCGRSSRTGRTSSAASASAARSRSRWRRSSRRTARRSGCLSFSTRGSAARVACVPISGGSRARCASGA